MRRAARTRKRKIRNANNAEMNENTHLVACCLWADVRDRASSALDSDGELEWKELPSSAVRRPALCRRMLLLVLARRGTFAGVTGSVVRSMRV